jgi:hypothetical protein
MVCSRSMLHAVTTQRNSAKTTPENKIDLRSLEEFVEEQNVPYQSGSLRTPPQRRGNGRDHCIDDRWYNKLSFVSLSPDTHSRMVSAPPFSFVEQTYTIHKVSTVSNRAQPSCWSIFLMYFKKWGGEWLNTSHAHRTALLYWTRSVPAMQAASQIRGLSGFLKRTIRTVYICRISVLAVVKREYIECSVQSQVLQVEYCGEDLVEEQPVIQLDTIQR